MGGEAGRAGFRIGGGESAKEDYRRFTNGKEYHAIYAISDKSYEGFKPDY
jgi:hypothetical protein